ncbi:MAG: AAA family ATPase [Phycisphaerales bacterium JB061]|jgi:MoxR-like ATPase
MQEALHSLRESIARVYFGDPKAIDKVLCCLLARGHLLLEDVPGVGKTVLASAVARCVGGEFRRIQMTPDMLPSDVLGVSIYEESTREFRFRPGPVFANVLLADEVNRTPPRTQSALLEAMNEAAVTIDGVTHRIAPPFMVVATQNPSSFHGTYPLPESQLDRFLLRTSLGYPSAESEVRVIQERPSLNTLGDLKPTLTLEQIQIMQETTDKTRLEAPIAAYIQQLADKSRNTPDLSLGLSTRGALAVAQASRATARLHDRDYVTPEDVAEHFVAATSHRITPSDPALIDHSAAMEQIAEDILRTVPAPI